MDPVTALANVAVALLKFLTVLAEGQTAAQREKLTDFYIADLERWRKLFKLDSEPKKP